MLKFHQIADRQIVNRDRPSADAPKISVVFLALSHFSLEYSLKCIDSIMAQTLHDYECIILDCNLQAGFVETIESHVEKDPRFLIVRHDVQMELPVAFWLNQGILLAKAPFIALNPNGTLWHPDALEQLMAASDTHFVDVIFGSMEFDQQLHYPSSHATVSSDMIDYVNIIPVGATLCRSQFFREYGLFDPHIFLNGFYDWELWRRALKLGGSYYYFDHIIGVGPENPQLSDQQLDIYCRAYLLDDRCLRARSNALMAGAIDSYDLVGSEKVLQYVRDIIEWGIVEQKYFKSYESLRNGKIEYVPPTIHNRLYDPLVNGYSLNPPMAVSKLRKRVLLVSDHTDLMVADWKTALVADKNNIIVAGRFESLNLFTPDEVDCLILFNCIEDDIGLAAYRFKYSGVSVLHIVTRDFLEKNINSQPDFLKKWKKSVDEVFVIEEPFSGKKSRNRLISYTTVTMPSNGLEEHDDKWRHAAPGFGLFAGNCLMQNIPNFLDVLALQKEYKWKIFISPESEDTFASLPDNVQLIYTNESFHDLNSTLSNFCLFVPNDMLTALDSYQRFLLDEEAVRLHNIIVPLEDADEILKNKDIGNYIDTQFEKWRNASVGHHLNARSLHIQNLIMGTDIRKKVSILRGQEASSNVKMLVMVNSQAIAGSENYGLLVTKGLFDLGFDVQFCTPSKVNTYPVGLKASQEWLKKRDLPAPIQADYGQAGYALWHPDFPEEEVFVQASKFKKWLEKNGFGLIFCCAMIPEPFITPREKALSFMALFAPWEYNLNRLTFIGRGVDGLFSDSHWALDPWVEMNPSLSAYTPSMIESENFKILNGDLPMEPIRIAIAGTIQPNKRQKEAVLAVRDLINKGHKVVLNIYGYHLDAFQLYIQEVIELMSSPDLNGKVKFWGFVEDPHQIARDNHIILCASMNESASQSVLFNQAAGLIAVGCPAGGIPEVVIDGETGFLADGFDYEHVAGALQRAIERREEWPQLIANARRFLLNECAEPEFMRRILKVMVAAAEIKLSRGRGLFHDDRTESSHTSVEDVSAPLLADLRIGIDLGDKSVVYYVQAENDGLMGITFQPGTYGSKPKGEMVISVFQAGHSERLRVVNVDLGDLKDNNWSMITFGPILSSKGKKYKFVVNTEISHGRIAFYEWFSDKWNSKWIRLMLQIEQAFYYYLPVPIKRPPFVFAFFPLYHVD